MNCPVCGEPVRSGTPKCLRCGYQFKSLIISDYSRNENADEHEDDAEYKEIDPDNIHMGRGVKTGGSILDELFGGSIFGSRSFGGGIFGGFTSIFDDIFDGLFGVPDTDDEQGYDGENCYTDEFGNPVPIDVFDRDFVEVAEIEEYDADGNLKEKQDKNSGHKNFFRRKKRDDKK